MFSTFNETLMRIYVFNILLYSVFQSIHSVDNSQISAMRASFFSQCAYS